MTWSRPARTEFLARRYLASRGGAPMASDPLGVALPRLRQEAIVTGRRAWLDLLLALLLAGSGLGTALVMFWVPLHGGLLVALLQMHVALAAGVGVGIWAAVVLEVSGPRLMTARRISRKLREGALHEALELGLRMPSRPV